MNKAPTDGQLDAGATYADEDEPSLRAASSAVLVFNGRAQAQIADAMKRINGAIICLDRVLASDLDVNDTIRVFEKIRELHDALDETRKRLNEKVKKLSEDTIPKLFQAKRQSSVTLMIGNMKKRITVSYRVSASMVDKAKGHAWLRKNKQADLITETVNAGTLGAWINADFLKKNKEPPDVFKVSVSPFTSITGVDR